MTARQDERLLELLADEATEGLGPAERAELETLLAAASEVEADAFEQAAAAIDLAYTEIKEPLPAALRDHIGAAAARYLPAAAATEVASFPSPTPSRGKGPDVFRWLGWLAAAAVLVAAVLDLLPRTGTDEAPETQIVQVPVPVQPPPPPPPAESREQLLAAGTDLLQLPWTTTEDAAAQGTDGDLVWSGEQNEGYLRVRGLPVNDPADYQYQIWIFDRTQDERYPISGGVFDVPAAGEVVVPLAPELDIVEPTLFAVTIEKPGGVVVSDRERLLLLAQV